MLNEGVDTTKGNSFTTTLDASSITTFTTSPEHGGRYGNAAPVADAGADQTVTDEDNNGYEPVTLDGSASHDGDGSVTIYTWSEAGKQIADGMQPVVNIETGIHHILLTVADSDGAIATDSVTVTVNMASESPIPALCSPIVSGVTLKLTVSLSLPSSVTSLVCITTSSSFRLAS